MSFADDLRKPDAPKMKDYSWEIQRANQCIDAIKDACLLSKKNGKNFICGGFFCDDADYGTYRIVEKFEGTVFTEQEASYDYIEENIINGIKALGFSRFNVTHKVQQLQKVTGHTIFGKAKTKGIGKMGHSYYIEIEW